MGDALEGLLVDIGQGILARRRMPYNTHLRFTESAEELVRLDVDVIVAVSAPALRAAYAATRTIPIVGSDWTNDPIAVGYAESYSRPGKNITGTFLDAPEFAGKWLDLLKAVKPGLKRVAILFDPTPGPTHLHAVQQASRKHGVELRVQEVHTPEDFEKAFAAFRGWAQGLIVLPSPMSYTYQSGARLAQLALKYRLPATAMNRTFAEAGGAIAYGPDDFQTFQREAAIVAKILGGAKPGDIPIERPTKFEFVINMKTIKALGLKVPDTLLLGAEQVNR